MQSKSYELERAAIAATNWSPQFRLRVQVARAMVLGGASNHELRTEHGRFVVTAALESLGPTFQLRLRAFPGNLPANEPSVDVPHSHAGVQRRGSHHAVESRLEAGGDVGELRDENRIADGRLPLAATSRRVA